MKKTITLILLLTLIILIYDKVNINNTKPVYNSNNNIVNTILENTKCDLYLDKEYYNSCYSYKNKGVIYSFTLLDRDIVNKSIKERPSFKSDDTIPTKYKTKYSNYTNSGFDRGHIQSDASFDSDLKRLESTYLMSNITPQYPNTNRKSYLEVEKRERELVNEFNNINSFTYITYSEMKVKDFIIIPKSFYKIFYINDFQECYHIPNDNISYKLEEMLINCEMIIQNI